MFGESRENKFRRVEPDAPDRCQATHADYQCPFGAVEGSKFCPRHSGNLADVQRKKADTRLYFAALYRDRIGQHAEHAKVKTIREEIGILRITLDNILEKATDPQQLLLYTGKITELTREIGKLVVACQRLETSMGKTLDQSQALAWIQEVLDIITEEVPDEKILQNLSQKMVASLEKRMP